MKKILIILLITILSFSLLYGCGSNDKKIEKEVAKYVKYLEKDALEYVTFSNEEINPKNVEVGFSNVTLEFLKGDQKSFSEILSLSTPIIELGLVKDSAYTEIEIDQVLKLLVEKGERINIYFDNNDTVIYQIYSDKVMVDEMTGKDNGAMRNNYEYTFLEG